MAVTGAQGFEDLAFAISLMVGCQCLLAQEFKLADVGLEFQAEAMQVLAEHGSELEFGGGASGAEFFRIGLRGVREKALQLCECLLSTSHLETGVLELQSALAFDTLPEAEERSESETEGHRGGVQAGRAMRRSREFFMTATSCADCMRNSRRAGMSAMARSRSGSLFFW